MGTKETEGIQPEMVKNQKIQNSPKASDSTPRENPTTPTQSTIASLPDRVSVPSLTQKQGTIQPMGKTGKSKDAPSSEDCFKKDEQDREVATAKEETAGKTTERAGNDTIQQTEVGYAANKVKGASKGEKHPTTEALSANAAESLVNSGNDRVTVDKSHQPLVQAGPGPVTEAALVTAKMNTASTTAEAEHIQKSTTFAVAMSVTAPKNAAVPSLAKTGSSVDVASKKESPSAALAAATKKPAASSAAKSSAMKTPPVVKQTNNTKVPSKIEVPSSVAKSAQGSQSKSIATASPTSTSSRGPIAAKAQMTPSAVVGTSAASNAESSSEPAAPMDEASILEEATRKLRAPLVDVYSPYIVASDTSLKDARERLWKALGQTRKLRSAFTDRVYGKYRVCLQPPPTTDAVLKGITAAPREICTKLEEEIKNLKEEKDFEKKEAQKLNAELTAASNEGGIPASVNADNAEQLMYISAGLSLVILPEKDASAFDMTTYTDRAPVNPETGQRVRSISAAAAAAGEVMLDRARKAAAMRAERQRRRQLQLLAGEDPDKESDSDNYSRLSLLSSTLTVTPTIVPMPKQPIPTPVTSSEGQIDPPPTTASATTTTAVKASTSTSTTATTITTATTPIAKTVATATTKPVIPASASATKITPRRPCAKTSGALSAAAAAACAKQIRARVQTNMSVQTLLSMHPSAEELRTDGKQCGATIALLERGVGSHGIHHKPTSQLKQKHPFPESLAAKRRPSTQTTTGSKKDISSPHPLSTVTHSNLGLALPPLATSSAKDNSGKNRIQVLTCSKASTRRAMDAIACVLDQFTDFTGKIGLAENSTMDTIARPRKRRVTEIDILHGIYKKNNFQDFKFTEATVPFNTVGKTARASHKIDPVLAFNVLRSVGLIIPSTNEDDDVSIRRKYLSSLIDSSLLKSIDTKKEGDHGLHTSPSVSKLNRLSQRILSHKRTFTEAFSARHALACSQPGNESLQKNNKSSRDSVVVPDAKSPFDETSVDGKAKATITSAPPAQVEASKEGESIVNTPRVPEPKAPAIVSIRGGGDALVGGGGNQSNPNQNPGNQNSGHQPTNAGNKPAESESGDMRRDSAAGKDTQQQPQMQIQRNNRPPNTQMQSAASQGQPGGGVSGVDMAAHRMMWEDPTRHSLVLLNPPRMVSSDSGYGMPSSRENPLLSHGTGPNAMPGNQMQMPLGHYHHHSTANALQLAHHLRHATASISRLTSQGRPGAGDLSDYIGGLHHQSQGPGVYDLSSIGAASAAALAAHSSLAVLGISPHRAAMANYQDRAARVMLAREHQAAAHAAAAHRHGLTSQQAAAFLGGAGNYFPHLAQHSAATAALLNQSAAMMGHSGMQPVPQPVPSARLAPQVQDLQSPQPTRKEQPAKKEQSPKESPSKIPQPSKKQVSQKEETARKDAVGKEQAAPKPSEAQKRAAPVSGSADSKQLLADKGDTTEEPDKKKRALSDPESKRPEEMIPLSEVQPPAHQKLVEKKQVGVTKPFVETNGGCVDHPVSLPRLEIPAADLLSPKSDATCLVGSTSPENPAKKSCSDTKTQGSGPTNANPNDAMARTLQLDFKKEDADSTAVTEARGMSFFVPPAPPTITSEIASLVLEANFADAIDLAESNTNTCPGGVAVVEYLMSVGAAVPIPKALVAGPLKDRIMASPGPKGNQVSGVASIPREVSN
jgi:hypothetical protein